MQYIVGLFNYSSLFLIVFFSVFLMVTLIENRKKIKDEKALRSHNDTEAENTDYPSVTILVPVFNEQNTVDKTIQSLLKMNYPEDKLKIMIVDDGSKDNTWEIVKKYNNHPQILLHQKENGGKYTALNYGIANCSTEMIGCLDADSEVDADALLHIIPYFADKDVGAVTPSLKIQNPDNILGLMQSAEYNMGVFTRKILGFLDAQYVTPGPFSIFRKEVFSKVGNYKHAHNTEDLEMALRLQENHFKIVNAHKAVVYTVGPRTLYRLYKQRVRWTGGFIQNAIDYRRMILNPKYGNLGMLILPVAMYSIVVTVFFLGFTIVKTIFNIIDTYKKIQAIGWSFNFNAFSFDWWLYNIQAPMFIGLITVSLVIFSIWYGKKLTGVKDKRMIDIVYFIILYSLISPLWLITSVYNTVRRKDASWR
jgi:cellulose synthase/poly-beta-1,6-N-acetylglucosamine synthase-like glycosyltransferase